MLLSVECNENLSKHSWFNLGGPAKIIFKPKNLNELSLFLKNLKGTEKIKILGAGSNTLIRDGGFNGIIIKLGESFRHISLFDKNTIICTKNGKKKIKDICVNNILEDNSIVTGIIKSSMRAAVMYKYNDILVTGEHFVQRKGEWIKVKNHPDSKRIYLYDES